METWGIGEFLGQMFFLPILIYLSFAIIDGFGLFRSVFETREKYLR